MSLSVATVQSLNLALGEFSNSLNASGLFDAVQMQKIIAQRKLDIIKLNNNPDDVQAYYHRLNAMIGLCEKIKILSITQSLDANAIPPAIQKDFTQTQQNIVQDHLALAAGLLMQSNISKNLDIRLGNTNRRLDVLTQYVQNPNSLINYALLADETQKVSELVHSPVRNFLLGNLKTLVGIGGLVISAALIAALGIAHGASLPLAEKIGVTSLSIITEGINQVLEINTPSLVEKFAEKTHKNMRLFAGQPVDEIKENASLSKTFGKKH